jgi:hypothetical protein
LDLLLHTHFPNSVAEEEGVAPVNISCTKRLDWHVATKVVSYGIVWAINYFAPYKSPGMDRIFPALLQEGWVILFINLVKIFCTCVAIGHVPATWRQAKVMFIPKPGRDSYGGPKDYRPISLTSFLLKTTERLIDRSLTDEILTVMPLHPYQYTYQAGKSVETALHHLLVRTEKALDQQETTLGIFLDIQGAFNNTSYDSNCAALAKHAVSSTIILWIRDTLEGQLAVAILGGVSRSVRVARGCPQGGALSPLLWCLVDELIARLNGGWGLYSRMCI